MRGLRGLDAAFRRIEDVMMICALIAFVAMVAVTTIDVGLRYVLNRPFTWAIPVTTNYLLVALYFCAISATQRDRQHLGIDLLTRILRPRWRALASAATGLTSFVLCAAVFAFTADVFWASWVKDEVMPGIIAWPLWPSHLLVPLGFGVASLRLALQFAREVAGAFGQSPLQASAPDPRGARGE